MSERRYLQGTLDVLVLKTLSWGPMHGYGIATWLEATVGDWLRLEEGSLYPALYRLERRGQVASEWRISSKGRKAKFYRLTAAGRKQLRAEQRDWSVFAAAVTRLLDLETAPASLEALR